MTMFQGQAGQPVPQVDPLDIKAVWQIGKETMESHPGQNVGIGVEFFERACKPGANIPAVTYRAGMIAMFQSRRTRATGPFAPGQARRRVPSHRGDSDGMDWRRRAEWLSV